MRTVLLIAALTLAACTAEQDLGMRPDAQTQEAGLPPSDARCEALCADSTTDAKCDPGVLRCELECNARVEGLSMLCSACLVERARRERRVCLRGEACCSGGVEFPNGVLDCAASCADDVGASVRAPDPRCEAICGVIDADECGAARSACSSTCQARIDGTTGLCATCLLDGASVAGSVCLSGGPCCSMNLEFRTRVEECAAICAR